MTFSKLSDRKGTRTKISMFNGSAWVDVKSIATKNDEYTIETPTAVMGVRGTHFLFMVDSVTGMTSVAVAAGQVQTAATSAGKEPAGDALQGKNTVLLAPTQQIQLFPDDSPSNLLDNVTVADVKSLVEQASPEIIKAFILNGPSIEEENKQLIEQLNNEMSSGEDGVNAGSLNIASIDDLNRVSQNMRNFVGVIAREAVAAKKISDGEVRDILDQTSQQMENQNAALQITSEEQKGLDRLLEQMERFRQAFLKNRQEELDRQNQDFLNRLNAQKEQLEAANLMTRKEQQDKAMEEYERQLSELEKQRFQQDQQQREQESSTSPSKSPSKGSGSGSSPSTTPSTSPSPSPSESPYVNPLQSLRVEYEYVPDAEIPSPSPTPLAVTADIPLSVTLSVYDYTLPGTAGTLNLTPLAKEEGSSIKVTINGIPVPKDGDVFYVPLNAEENRIDISVRPSGSSAYVSAHMPTFPKRTTRTVCGTTSRGNSNLS